MSQRSLRDATLVIKDGACEELTVKLGDGDITWTEKRNIEYVKDRGILDQTRLGEDEPVEVSIEFIYDWLESNSITGTTSISEMIKGTAGQTTTGGACEPYACDLELTVTNSCESVDEVITFSEFRWTDYSPGIKDGMITVSGACNEVSPTVV